MKTIAFNGYFQRLKKMVPLRIYGAKYFTFIVSFDVIRCNNLKNWHFYCLCFMYVEMESEEDTWGAI